MKALQKLLSSPFNRSSRFQSLFKTPPRSPFSTLAEYFKVFENVPPFLITHPELMQKYGNLISDIKSNTIQIRNFGDLVKLIQIFRKIRSEDTEAATHIAKIIKGVLEKKDSNLFDFLEIFEIFASEKQYFIPIAKEVILPALVQKLSKLEISEFNVDQAAGVVHYIILFEVGYKEIYDFLQNSHRDVTLNREVINNLATRFTCFQKNAKLISDKYLVELLQAYFVIMRAVLRLPEYKTFFYSVQDKIYKNLKLFSTEQLTTLAILYQANNIIHKPFWDSLEEEVHFRLNEWNLSHLMKVCDCFMSVKEGSLNFYNEIQKFFMNNIDCINLEEIPYFIQILIQDEKIMDPFLSQLEVKILSSFNSFDENQLSRILWSFALRKQLNNELFTRIEKTLMEKINAVKPFELVLALYAMKFAKKESKLLTVAKARVPEIIDQNLGDHEILMGLLYAYCDDFKNEPFFPQLQKAIEVMVAQSTPAVFLDFLRICIQVHKDKENLFDNYIYELAKARFFELEKHYRDEEKLEMKEAFKYLGFDMI